MFACRDLYIVRAYPLLSSQDEITYYTLDKRVLMNHRPCSDWGVLLISIGQFISSFSSYASSMDGLIYSSRVCMASSRHCIRQMATRLPTMTNVAIFSRRGRYIVTSLVFSQPLRSSAIDQRHFKGSSSSSLSASRAGWGVRTNRMMALHPGTSHLAA